MISLLLAQVDALSGGAGWAGAGILGLVLAWLLLRHLPAKDAQLKELLATHQAAMNAKDQAHEMAVKEIVAVFVANEKERRAEFKDSLNQILAHCERGEQRTANAIKEAFAAIDKPLIDLKNAILGLHQDLGTRTTT